MWIYLMCFVISTICIYCGEKAYNKSFKYASFFFGVMILAVVAGYRDQVGRYRCYGLWGEIL